MSDLAPHLLDPEVRKAIPLAKERARRRVLLEAKIPERLLYQQGWPVCIPTWEEAVMLAEVRHEVAQLHEIPIEYEEPSAIITRFEELMEVRRKREEAKALKQMRAALSTIEEIEDDAVYTLEAVSDQWEEPQL